MKTVSCAGSVPNRCASRLGQPTSDLSTTQVPVERRIFPATMPLARALGDLPSQGSRPQSRANDSCTAAINYLLGVGGLSGPGIIGPPGTVFACISSARLQEATELDDLIERITGATRTGEHLRTDEDHLT